MLLTGVRWRLDSVQEVPVHPTEVVLDHVRIEQPDDRNPHPEK
jgi:hypothetical protein